TIGLATTYFVRGLLDRHGKDGVSQVRAANVYAEARSCERAVQQFTNAFRGVLGTKQATSKWQIRAKTRSDR
ncbi:MAG TPA: hypothetical protein VFS23_36505, partial [Vicinamibacterales bacterium]|nr:hypothetical protein [Vicinamibacterales bacterium]